MEQVNTFSMMGILDMTGEKALVSCCVRPFMLQVLELSLKQNARVMVLLKIKIIALLKDVVLLFSTIPLTMLILPIIFICTTHILKGKRFPGLDKMEFQM